ncbi:MAG: 1-deoxy-D-xylulose 5-phosphate reductoisomerase [Phycisphaeraceae bacterium]|nr:MAG: 1-deoxy-D-xylulose 5-phosphate reductoisomerase [Phycisphaeraceae bacterium]
MPTPKAEPAPSPTARPGAPAAVRRVAVLGSAGSIGTQTLAVLDHLNALHARGEHPTRYEVVALATGSNAATLAAQSRQWPGAALAVASPAADLPDGARTGPGSPADLVRDTAPDLVVSAIVGVAGLPPTLAALELGADVALANKESLVAAGDLVVRTAHRTGARLLPIDSEHAAIWQALHRADRTAVCPPCTASPAVARVTLTASGGAFRDTPADQLAHVTPEQALAHPTWDMGDKITIDCATLINKALELIEARWLFGLGNDRLGVVVHRESVVHSLVAYRDGNVLAQLGTNDMRIAIQHAITFPARALSPAEPLCLSALGSLTFEEPDLARFPGLALATRVIDAGANAGAVLNGANEAAVGAFLAGRIPFPRIAELCAHALDDTPAHNIDTLEDALRADAAARAAVEHRIAGDA